MQNTPQFNIGDIIVGTTRYGSSSDVEFALITKVGKTKYSAKKIPFIPSIPSTSEGVRAPAGHVEGVITYVEPDIKAPRGKSYIFIPKDTLQRKANSYSSVTYNEVYDPNKKYHCYTDSWR